MKPASIETRIGISGWRYQPWRNVFYPDKLAQSKELFFASRQVNSIELNGSFYSLQSATSYKNWYAETPEDFKFSVKGPQYITHVRHLREVEAPLANFFASGVLHFKEKMGPILWQFPPNFTFDEEKLEAFLKILPHTFKEAVQLTKKADRVEPDVPTSKGLLNLKIRHAMEVRHSSFENPYFPELLKKYDVALVFADTAGLWPYMEDVTSDFIYLRLHGDEELYASGYSLESIKWWGDRIKTWQKGKTPKPDFTLGEKKSISRSLDAFIYFDNSVKIHAPFNAQELAKILLGPKT